MSFGITELILILIIVLLLICAKKLPKLSNLGSELGGAIKNFRSAIKNENNTEETAKKTSGNVIEGEVEKKSVPPEDNS